MATSVYFQNYNITGEQDLLHNLVMESIRIYGVDMYYIPRSPKMYDKLYGEDASSEYNRAFLVEMYVKSVDGFTGDGNFMSKFGLQIRDQAVFSVAQRTFSNEIGITTGQIRPNEGDLVYFPLNDKCFKIMYVKKQEFFYPLGTLPTWEITVELFEYSNEKFSTGIGEIDKLQQNYSTDLLSYSITDENGDYLVTESGDYIIQESYNLETVNPSADNDTIQFGSNNFPIGSDDFVDFTETNPFSEDNY
jgi:hypothetical protein